MRKGVEADGGARRGGVGSQSDAVWHPGVLSWLCSGCVRVGRRASNHEFLQSWLPSHLCCLLFYG